MCPSYLSTQIHQRLPKLVSNWCHIKLKSQKILDFTGFIYPETSLSGGHGFSICLSPIIPDYTTQIDHFTSDYFRPLRSIFSQKQVISNLCGQANAVPLSKTNCPACLPSLQMFPASFLLLPPHRCPWWFRCFCVPSQTESPSGCSPLHRALSQRYVSKHDMRS